MDYKKIYDDLMRSRISIKEKRNREKKSGIYFERHHIVPISLNGDKSYAINSPNIVLLTAREHYLAHRMLWLIYRTREMGFAFHKMVFSTSPLQERRFDSRSYEAAKNAFSECQRGKNNPMWGRESSMKGKVPTSKGKKLEPRPYLTGDNNPSRREEVREKISKALKGKKKPPIKIKHREELSERSKGENNPMFGKFKSHFTDLKIFEYSSIDGVFIREWRNVTEASDFYKIDRRKIYNSVIGKSQSCNKSIWLYDFMGGKINLSDYLKLIKKVIEINGEGKILNSWESSSLACKDIGISPSLLSQIVNNKRIHKGRIFKFLEQ
jgi:hypothetical protein